MVALVFGLYFGCLFLLGVVSLERLWMTLRALICEDRAVGPLTEAPKLVVQLPIYNEALVVERALRAVAGLRYPEGRLQVQVLDDSTDETSAIVQRVASELGLDVVRRGDRRAYKAGALAHGLTKTDAELVAIFDADFVPNPDFLEATVPALLADPRCGMVQARWSHLNREASWLTRAQAIFLDGHFAIEHRARDAAGCFFNFNGTAGVWRRAAIESAGGWRGDTLTEDLDLSYRAQLAGWRFLYLDQVIAPAELPESFDAFRAQQARWVKGSVQTGRLLLRRVLEAPIPWWVRVDAALHLTNNLAYLLMTTLALLLPISVLLRGELGWPVPGGGPLLALLDVGFLGGGTILVAAYFLSAQVRLGSLLTPTRALEVLFALCMGAGLCFSNAAAALRAFGRSPGEFERTPKRGEARVEVALRRYRSRSSVGLALFELGACAYCSIGLVYALSAQLLGAVPFLAMYVVGFSTLGFGTLKEARRPKASPMIVPISRSS